MSSPPSEYKWICKGWNDEVDSRIIIYYRCSYILLPVWMWVKKILCSTELCWTCACDDVLRCVVTWGISVGMESRGGGAYGGVLSGALWRTLFLLPSKEHSKEYSLAFYFTTPQHSTAQHSTHNKNEVVLPAVAILEVEVVAEYFFN